MLGFRAQYARILSAAEDTDQTFHLHVKEEKSGATPKYVACKKELTPGSICFVVNALWAPMHDDRARSRNYYICSTRPCVFKPSPPWANIRAPTNFTTASNVPEGERRRVEAECQISTVA